MNNWCQANDHLVINLPPPIGGNAGRGGWPQTPSPQGLTPSSQGQTPSSSEMSSNLYIQTLPPPYPSPLGLNQGSFTYEELAVATYRFSQSNLLRQGGFGFVHKGVLPNGKEVAVRVSNLVAGRVNVNFKPKLRLLVASIIATSCLLLDIPW
ncbi:hypothetical protein CRYUN_Cryun06bG0042100 [Craigia yunnanensis]